MDEHTETHFRIWLDRNVFEDERAEVERQIRALVASDPELLDTHSWPELRRMAEALV